MNNCFPLHTDLLVRWRIETMSGDVPFAQVVAIDCTGRRYSLETIRRGQMLMAWFRADCQRFIGWIDLEFTITDDFGTTSQRIHHAALLSDHVQRPVGGSVLTLGAESQDSQNP